MNITPLKVSKTLNDAYRKQSLTAAQVSSFKQNLSILFNRINDAESEEYNKNIFADFLKDIISASKLLLIPQLFVIFGYQH